MALAAALQRNLLRGDGKAGEQLIDFVLELESRIADIDQESLLRGKLD